MTAHKTLWIRLGDCVEPCDERNNASASYPFYGMSRDKAFIPTVADTHGLDSSKYRIVRHSTFAFSGMQTGRDACIRIALQQGYDTLLVSPAYTTFRVKEVSILHPSFLYMLFCRAEMDRYGWFLSDGSVRSNLDWDRFCDMRIPLPPISVQRNLVAAYEGLLRLAEENETLIAQLNEACQALIAECKRSYPEVKLGDYIEEVREKNKEGLITTVLGLSTKKEFRVPSSRVNPAELKEYKIVRESQFAYVPTTDTWKVFACALNRENPIVVSPIYSVFRLRNPKGLLEEFLYLFLRDASFDRYARYNSWGSARENFNWEELCRVRIPLPPSGVQQAIVNLYRCMEEARAIAQEARELLRVLCPALIQQAIHS